MMANCFTLLKYMRFLPFIGPDMIALLGTLTNIRVLTFALFLTFYVVCVGLGAYLRYGADVLEFSGAGLSIISMVQAMFFDNYYGQMIGGYVILKKGIILLFF